MYIFAGGSRPILYIVVLCGNPHTRNQLDPFGRLVTICQCCVQTKTQPSTKLNRGYRGRLNYEAVKSVIKCRDEVSRTVKNGTVKKSRIVYERARTHSKSLFSQKRRPCDGAA